MAGKPHGKNLYGYSRRYDPQTRALLSVEPSDDAAVVVEVVDRLAAGESVRAVTNDLNERGVPTPTGKPSWHPTQVRRLALNPAYAGLRVHQGEVVGRADWPALVSEDRHRAVVARLTAPDRGRFRPGRTKHLLSGTARCGVCGGPLRVVLDRRRQTYSCFTPGCFRVAIGYDHLNEYVSEAVLARLERPDVAEALAAANGDDYMAAVDALSALQGRRTAIGEAMAAGMDVTAARTALDLLAVQIEEAEDRVRAAVRDPLLTEAAGPGAREHWEGLSDEQRAALVRLVVQPVVDGSTRPRGSRGFDAERVRLEWRV
jgi:hypothetical protein